MASKPATRLFTLGNLATARGKLGIAHSHATIDQMSAAAGIVTDPRNYSKVGTTVVCVEDRLDRPDSRLAGGALSLALMRNLLYDGLLLSEDLRDLKARDFHLALHADCGALGLVAQGFISSQLSNVNAEGYKLLDAMGYDVLMSVRKRIAEWANKLPTGYVDLEAAMKFVDEFDQVRGQHNAVFASVSREKGIGFVGGERLKRTTNGLLTFTFTPWAAIQNAERLVGARTAEARQDVLAAEALALLFTAQVFLTLGAPDLRVALYR